MNTQNALENIIKALFTSHILQPNEYEDFTKILRSSKTLLVGEGNLSFAKSLINDKCINPYLITATTYETEKELDEYALFNQRELNALGCETHNGIDATKLNDIFRFGAFNNIVFNFPNVASRTPKYGRNPNFIMLRKFMVSASFILPLGGKAIITLPDTLYYEGAFSLEESAQLARLTHVETAPFSYNDLPSYTHKNTKNNNSSLSNHSKFKTYVFEK